MAKAREESPLPVNTRGPSQPSATAQPTRMQTQLCTVATKCTATSPAPYLHVLKHRNPRFCPSSHGPESQGQSSLSTQRPLQWRRAGPKTAQAARQVSFYHRLQLLSSPWVPTHSQCTQAAPATPAENKGLHNSLTLEYYFLVS